MSPPTVVLITGTTRGIGEGILQLYLAKPNHIVISGNRDPSNAASQALLKFPTAEGTKHILVKIDCDVPTDPYDAVKELASQGIDHVDIVIANAGIALLWTKVSEVKTEDIQKHINTNVYGFLHLLQAFLPVLKRSQKPVWVTIGSCAGWLTLMTHWYTKALHIEEPEICAFPIDPGWAQTDLGNRGAAAFGFEAAAVPVADSAAGIVKVVDAATRETHSGNMWTHDGNVVPW
ncbi:hypothetical protein NUW58_g1503 [Xylaria curta]|uniref:Uncharacterized protein n=1 Tax=Xylaria curta TaxID=42375 RepID=A0ACC1PJV8_9PEZI|nr:hypothetical protein NUW58_g1503 [Xylaria curta]